MYELVIGDYMRTTLEVTGLISYVLTCIKNPSSGPDRATTDHGYPGRFLVHPAGVCLCCPESPWAEFPMGRGTVCLLYEMIDLPVGW